MTRKLTLFSLSAVCLFAASYSYSNTTETLVPAKQHDRATKLIAHFLDKYHYKEISINNSLSDQILWAYLEALDPNRSYFYQKDIDSFQIFRYKLDDAITKTELSAPFQMFRLYQARVDERVLYALDLLDRKFNFKIDEELIIDRSEFPWAKDSNELNEIWRKRVKNDVLTLRLADKENQRNKRNATKTL